MEIPEIEDGIIDIKEVSRVPGDRSKVIVFSSDKRIDAVGACVGMRGSRIQAIVRELNGEKIDIINWTPQVEVLISRALSPAKPLNMFIDEDKKYVVAVFDDEELPLAIGKNGQNIKLASDITGYKIDAVKESEYNSAESGKINISDIEDINDKYVKVLNEIGVITCNDFLDSDRKKLLDLNGIGEKTLEKITQIIIENNEN